MTYYGRVNLPDLDALRRRLDETIESAYRRIQQVEHSTAELREKRARDAERLTDKQIEAMKAGILARERTPEWQVVMERIAKGDFSWRHVITSYFAGTMDPDVKAAFDSLSDVPPLTPEQREKIKAELNKAEAQEAEAAAQQQDEEHGPYGGAPRSPYGGTGGSVPRRPRPDDWDDDDFEQFNFLR
ncbi:MULTISPECIES: hypothetical protein [Thermocrispum]|uniref:Uncharacterized protein n=1 Tax=Thermocrispum agreste TaxID=37925 RepID=A0A2W4JQP5_9PSEU|nr:MULTISPECIES: hypothetical protein [Thermocrispum]PZN01311.1 MAG: hypothetical protein DIU77_01070 [Thermocrispum agreste]